MINNNTQSFSGKVAFVTGGGSGIGRATAVAFAKEGAKVAIGYVTEEHAQGTRQLVEQAGGKAIAVKCDVSKDEEVKRAIEKTVQVFGRLDFAFNNAGVMQHRVDTAEITTEEWDRVLGVNLRGVFSCMRYEIPQMLKQGGGAIVNNSSIGGVVGNPGLSAYHAAKHGVIGLTRTAAIEYCTKGININAVCPGTINTPLAQSLAGSKTLDPKALDPLLVETPIKRPGTPEEVASAVIWLCSPGAGFVVGHAMLVDGGYTIH